MPDSQEIVHDDPSQAAASPRPTIEPEATTSAPASPKGDVSKADTTKNDKKGQKKGDNIAEKRVPGPPIDPPKKSKGSLRRSFYRITKLTAFRAVMGLAGFLAVLSTVSLILSSLVLAKYISWTASIDDSMDPYCRASSLGLGCLSIDPLAAIPWHGFVVWSAVFLLSTLLAFHGAIRLPSPRAQPMLPP
jgi:hypothetical protein